MNTTYTLTAGKKKTQRKSLKSKEFVKHYQKNSMKQFSFCFQFHLILKDHLSKIKEQKKP